MTTMIGEDPACPEDCDEAQLVAEELVKAWREADALRNGNTALLKALAACVEATPGFLVIALNTLADAKCIGADGKVNWAAIEARKPALMTWKDAVSRLTLPGPDRDRLLNLDGN